MRNFLAFLIFFGSVQVAFAQPFGLRVKIVSNGLPSGNLKARLHYAFEGSLHDQVPISGHGTQNNDQRNNYGQFIFSFDNLNFPVGVSRGFYWGRVMDRSEDILRYIPLTTFSREDLNDRRLIVQIVSAKPIGLDAFAASYPIHLPDTQFLDDDNVRFSLQAVRTLIDAGFVTSEREWQRIFDKFTANVNFFQRGGAEDVGLILRYLHDRYETLVSTEASIEAYSNFYLQFLSKLTDLNIGGLAAPDGTTLAHYTLARQLKIIEDQGSAMLDQVKNAQAILIKARKPMPCMQLSQTMLKVLNADNAFWSDIVTRPEVEKNIKIFLKRFVDCAQRHYVDYGPDSASLVSLEGGFAFLFDENSIGYQVVNSFSATVLKLEERGLFLRGNRYGPYRQVYVYYDEYLER